MKDFDQREALIRRGSVALFSGVLVSLMLLPQANGDLVYDQNPSGVQSADIPQPAQERVLTRKALISSQRAQATRRAQTPSQVVNAPVLVSPTQPVYAPVVAPVASVPAASDPEVDNLTRAELLRRERLRTELQNEDVLQERLEELRLRDENRRTGEILGQGGQPTDPFAEEAEEIVVQPPVQQPFTVQSVSSNGGSGQQYLVDSLYQSQAAPIAPGAGLSSTQEDEDGPLNLQVSGRGGLANFANSSGYDVNGRYSLGLDVGFVFSEYAILGLGYTFSEYGVRLGSTNPFVNQVQGFGFPGNNFETLALKQNVFDLGVKLSLLGQRSRIRPFVGGGVGYAKSFINYDDRILQQLRRWGYRGYGSAYEVEQFLGILQTGLDVALSDAISLVLGLKYYKVLSSKENQELNNFAFGGPYGSYNTYGNFNWDKQLVGGSLARSSFYTVHAGVGFSF